MDGKKLVTVRISEEAEEALIRMLEAVNKDFTAGQVHRAQLVSWILIQFEKRSLAANLELVRKDHFDPIIYLEEKVREIKAAQANGAELAELTRLLSPLARKGTGKVTKRSPEKVSDAVVDKLTELSQGRKASDHG